MKEARSLQLAEMATDLLGILDSLDHLRLDEDSRHPIDDWDDLDPEVLATTRRFAEACARIADYDAMVSGPVMPHLDNIRSGIDRMREVQGGQLENLRLAVEQFGHA